MNRTPPVITSAVITPQTIVVGTPLQCVVEWDGFPRAPVEVVWRDGRRTLASGPTYTPQTVPFDLNAVVTVDNTVGTATTVAVIDPPAPSTGSLVYDAGVFDSGVFE